MTELPFQASAVILDGRRLAGEIKEKLKREVRGLKESTGKVPHLVNVMIGQNHSSCAYAGSQKRMAEEIGLLYTLAALPPTVSQTELTGYIHRLNEDKNVHGIMIHKPVPSPVNYRALANGVSIEKDLEGINVTNIGKMILGEARLIPCTPAAVMEHIRSTGVSLRGKEAVIVGHSEIVGKPLSLLLLDGYATVTICHIATSEAGSLAGHAARADILVVAVGKAGLIKGEWIKKGAVVIDVGINQVDGRVLGDVEFESARKRAGFITPVPGGVGPVTVVMLMRNGVEAFKIQTHLQEKS